jgi:glutathione S-transferase
MSGKAAHRVGRGQSTPDAGKRRPLLRIRVLPGPQIKRVGKRTTVDSTPTRTTNMDKQTSEATMKLYNAPAPNPRRVRIFLAEKGIVIPRVELDLPAGENRSAEFRKLNSLGQVPVLELDDGSVITESMAICRYLEELHPEPSLFGRNARDRARIEMWERRISNELFIRIGNVALNALPFFATRRTQVAAFAQAERQVVPEKWAWLDGELADGRPFIAGADFSVADITGMAASLLGEMLEIEVPASLTNVRRWDASVRARPSWSA